MKRIIYTIVGMMLSVGTWADTLQEQINNAASGETITLTEDVTIDQTVLVDKSITIDGGGHTITSSVDNILGTIYVNTPDCNLTIKNVKFEGNNTASMAVVAYRGEAKDDFSGVVSVNINNAGNIITLNSCKVQNFMGYPGSYVGAVYAYSRSTVNLIDCTFSGNTTSASTNGASGADVWGGAASTININGGSYQEVFVNSNAGDEAKVTVSNGASVAELAVCATEKADGITNIPTVVVDNATVTTLATEEGNPIPDNDVTIQNGGSITNLPAVEVAKIGIKKYGSLADAVAAATEGQTITVLSDVTVSTVDEITVNKKLTLDLAGHTITSTVKEPIVVKNGGDLTITGNGTIAGPADEAGKSLDGYAIITVEGGKLTYLNGTLTCGGVGSDGMYGVYILNGGTAVFGEEVGKTGPTITSWFAAIGENNTTAPANVTVYGGSYTAQANPSVSDWWSYFCAPIYAAGSGDINISGGEFNGYYGLSSRYSNIDQNLNITGGTFTGTKSALFFDNKTGVASSESRDVAVSGGTFSSAVPEEYCADGFIPQDNGDGTYGVKEGSYVAKVGENKYETLAAAVAAATASQTVTLLKDITLTQRVEPNKDMTIDLNGKKITTTATCGNGSAFNIVSGTVTIQNGTIDASFGEANSGETDAITARSGSDVTLKDINITVKSKNGACVYAFEGGHITIESGNYENQTTEAYEYNNKFQALVVNQANVETQLVTINGGIFIGQDPSDGDDSGKAETFVSENLATQLVDGHYEIIAAVAKIGVKGYATFEGALDAVKESETITLLANAEVETIDVVADKTIKKNGFEITVNTFEVIDFGTFNIPFDFVAKTATYKRNVAGNEWGTVCVPFTLKSTEAIKLYTFGNISGDVLTVNEVETAAPGTPVVFANTAKAASVTFSTVDASVSATAPATTGTLAGTYTAKTITEGLENIYYINGDKFHQAKASLTVPAYRAYIQYTASGAKPAMLSLNIGGEATGIDNVVNVLNNGVTAVYDANGRQLQAPQKGLNIMKLANGKTVKLIIK